MPAHIVSFCSISGFLLSVWFSNSSIKFLVNSSAISASHTAVISSPLRISSFIFKLFLPRAALVFSLALANAFFVALSSDSENLAIAPVSLFFFTTSTKFLTKMPSPLPSAWIIASLFLSFKIWLNSFNSINFTSFLSSLSFSRRLLNHLVCASLF